MLSFTMTQPILASVPWRTWPVSATAPVSGLSLFLQYSESGSWHGPNKQVSASYVLTSRPFHRLRAVSTPG